MNESSSGSISRWIADLKKGDVLATEKLWTRYFERLVNLARKKLGDFPRRAADEEDVAANVLMCLFEGAAKGRFDRLTDRQDLWLLLITITKQVSVDLIRHEQCQKRGGGRILDEQSGQVQKDSTSYVQLANLLSDEPGPEFLVALDDQLQHLLRRLGNEFHSRAAVMRIAGYSNEEIAVSMKRTLRTIERWQLIVRETWERELQQ
jgi:DNA-directed RNA polymerase specialized sigma24 family protein